MRSIDITDFDFNFLGKGSYEVTFTSRKTGKQYTSRITDMEIIDLTKNEDEPKVKDLNSLKRLCKM